MLCVDPGSRVVRTKHGSGLTLELRRVPAELNTIAKINEHFTRFGTLVNLQVYYDVTKILISMDTCSGELCLAIL